MTHHFPTTLAKFDECDSHGLEGFWVFALFDLTMISNDI